MKKHLSIAISVNSNSSFVYLLRDGLFSELTFSLHGNRKVVLSQVYFKVKNETATDKFAEEYFFYLIANLLNVVMFSLKN